MIPPSDLAKAATTAPTTWALASLSLAMLLSSLGASIANVALPTLAHTFNASFQDVQWIVLAYLLAITTVIVSVGRLGDLIGRRRLMLAGMALYITASSLCGAAPALWVLVGARALQGIGAAVMMALAMALISETVAKERTGSAMGLLGTMSAIGTSLGPTMGGLLIAGAGWRAIFLLNVPLGLLAMLLAWRCLPADRPAPAGKRPVFDLSGSLLLALTLGAYALAMTVGRGSIGKLNLALLLAAAVGTYLFVKVELKVDSPLIRLAMFRDPVLGAGFAMSVLVMTVMMATLVVGPFYLSGALGQSAAQTGLAMSCGPIVSALAGVPAGRIVDRFGARSMTIAGLSLLSAGCAALAMLPIELGVAGYVAMLIVATCGYALFQAANNTAVMKDVHADQRGVVSGLLGLSRNLGLVTGASVMGAIFAIGSGARAAAIARPDALAAGMHITFGAGTLLILVALTIAVFSARRRS